MNSNVLLRSFLDPNDEMLALKGASRVYLHSKDDRLVEWFGCQMGTIEWEGVL